MLVLTITRDEPIYLDGGRIVVHLIRSGPTKANLAFEAPPEVSIDRKSIHFDKLSRKLKSKEKP